MFAVSFLFSVCYLFVKLWSIYRRLNIRCKWWAKTTVRTSIAVGSEAGAFGSGAKSLPALHAILFEDGVTCDKQVVMTTAVTIQ